MLNKELLMGSAQGQRKVRLTIEKIDIISTIYGYLKDYSNSLNVLPYWGTTDNVIDRLAYYEDYNQCSFLIVNEPEVTAFADGYSTVLHSGKAVTGDPYAMRNSEGSARYLTFDPPPTGTWIQRHSNRSRNRVLRRRRSLGGSKC